MVLGCIGSRVIRSGLYTGVMVPRGSGLGSRACIGSGSVKECTKPPRPPDMVNRKGGRG